MGNKPEKIFLQVGEESFVDFEFKELDVSWCSEKINDNDLEFISIHKYNRLKRIFERLLVLHNVTEELRNFYRKHAGYEI